MSRKLEVIFSASTGQLERAFNKVARDSERLGKSGQTAGQHFSNFSKVAMIAGGVMGGVFLAGMHKATEAAITNEAAQAKLGAQLRTVGKDNEDVRGRIDRTVESLSRMSGFKGVELTGAFTALVRTTGNVTKSQKELALATDIARGRGISLAQASTLLNRVNVGSIGGLKRVGIEVDKNTTKEKALALLRQKFGGQAAAYANSAAGAQARLSATTEAAWEKIGTALTPVVIAFANFASNVVPRVISIVDTNKGVFIALAGAAGILWAAFTASKVINTMATAFRTLNVVMAANPFILVATAVVALGIALYEAYQHSETFRNAVNTAFTAVSNTVMNVVGPVIAWFRANWSQIVAIAMPVLTVLRTYVETAFNNIKIVITTVMGVVRGVIQTFTALLHGDFSGAINGIKTIVSSVFGGIVGIIRNTLSGALSAAKEVGLAIWHGIVDGLAALAGLAGKVVSGIGNALTAAVSWVGQRFLEVGSAIVEGIKNGISSAWDGFKSWLMDKLGSPVQWAKDLLGIGSPSRVFADQVGKPMADGIRVGFEKGHQQTKATLLSSIQDLVHSARANLGNLGQSMAGLAGQRYAATARGGVANDTLAGLQATEDARQRGLTDTRLNNEQAAADAAVTSATAARDATQEGTQARIDAEQALTDATQRQNDAREAITTETRQREIADLQKNIDERATKYQTDIDNLVAQFNRGGKSADDFQRELTALIGGPAGDDLGTAFGDSFNAQLNAMVGQAKAILSNANLGSVTGASSPNVENPSASAKEGWTQAIAKVKSRLEQQYADEHPNAKKGAGAAWVAQKLAAWKAANRSAYAMADGGVLTRAVIAGEAGPEAFLPLSSPRAGRMLASAMADAGMAGGTTVVVNVAGNEFSAADFARKLQPELARLISRRY